MRLKEALRKSLTKKELLSCPNSYDVIGDIAILEISPELEKKQKIIGNALLNLIKNVRVVVKKQGIHYGKHRLQKYRIIAGERRKKTIHKESGVRLKIHIEKTYFSPRSSTERLRIAGMVKKNENVLVMFSGIAPFPLVITRNANPKRVVGVELNSFAHEMAVENVHLNKMDNKIKLYEGDVKKILPKFKAVFDRIVMPLPKDAELYLEDALKVSRKGTKIHLYNFGTMEESKEMKKRIHSICKELKRKIRIDRVVKAGQYSPYVYRLCFDITVMN